jgi:hypothetical protein
MRRPSGATTRHHPLVIKVFLLPTNYSHDRLKAVNDINILSERLVWKITGLGLRSMLLAILNIPQNCQVNALMQGLFNP